MAVLELSSGTQLEELTSHRGLVVVHFWAPWSVPCRQMNEVMEDLATEHHTVKFVKVEAENYSELSIKYEVVAVPTFILLKGGLVVDRVNGAHAPELAKKTSLHSVSPPVSLAAPPPTKEDLKEHLKGLITAAPCMLFMKGTPQEPRCGFSRQMITILTEMHADYSTFNILADEKVRKGLKEYSNWPTYPQLYVRGELIGGLDIVKEMKESGDLEAMLPKAQSLDDRLKALIGQSPVMVFMKGSPEQPQCGFSRTLCGLLKDTGAQFDTFNILEDDEVRQGLKKYSNWPTYPQLYVKGELIGGLDIVKELQESGELLTTLEQSD